ncbi:hypothetical protein EVAR_42687_1 [Eumeta japonica]|uniref:Uncharacterized protein n=1 Tax=Eumeta variegata TaxID=151549 RepID=A0A4C1X2J0_EUMVA|nr:hypothetical protein EVAR_42687_1 [Eumeta japonica]
MPFTSRALCDMHAPPPARPPPSPYSSPVAPACPVSTSHVCAGLRASSGETVAIPLHTPRDASPRPAAAAGACSLSSDVACGGRRRGHLALGHLSPARPARPGAAAASAARRAHDTCRYRSRLIF